MALTKDEMEAKLAALEDRITFLAQVSDTLEWRLDHGVKKWDHWVVDLRRALIAITHQLDRLGKQLPLPPCQ